MKANTRIVAIIVLIAGLLSQFTNCAESLPDLGNYEQASQGTESETVNLHLAVQPQTIAVNQNSQITVVGGAGPYVYTVKAGTASVSSAGLVTGLAAGAVTVEVMDVDGNVANISITVSNAATTGTGTCTTAFGQVVPDGGQVNVYAAASVNCPSTCVAETQTCTNGVLSGTFVGQSGSCTVNACVYKLSTANICPPRGTGHRGFVTLLPSSCKSTELGKYICVSTVAKVNEYRCSAP